MASMDFEEWVRSRPGQGELGIQTALSQHMKERINLAMAEHMADAMARSVAYEAAKTGVRPEDVVLSQYQDPEAMVVSLSLSVETKAAPTLAGYILALEEANKQARALLGIPWWKLAWLRIRGRLPSMANPWDSIETK